MTRLLYIIEINISEKSLVGSLKQSHPALTPVVMAVVVSSVHSYTSRGEFILHDHLGEEREKLRDYLSFFIFRKRKM